MAVCAPNSTAPGIWQFAEAFSVRLSSSGQKPRMLLIVWKCTGQPPTAETYLTPNVSAEIANPVEVQTKHIPWMQECRWFRSRKEWPVALVYLDFINWTASLHPRKELAFEFLLCSILFLHVLFHGILRAILWRSAAASSFAKGDNITFTPLLLVRCYFALRF